MLNIPKLKDKKIKLLTHSDLDGIGCYIVMNQLLDDSNEIDFSFLRSADVGTKAMYAFYKSGDYEDYDALFITDLAVDDYIMEIYEKELKDEIDLYYIDHHLKSIKHHEKDWVHATVKNEFDKLTSGSELCYDLLLKNQNEKDNLFLEQLVENITLYDTWRWTEEKMEEEWKHPWELNTFFYMIGIPKYLDLMSKENLESVHTMNDFMHKPEVDLVLYIAKNDLDAYIGKKEKSIEYITDKPTGLKYGIIIGEQHINDVCHYFLEDKNVDFIVFYNTNSSTVSLRSSELDVSDIAEHFKGGGHENASGFSLYNFKDDIVKALNGRLRDGIRKIKEE